MDLRGGVYSSCGEGEKGERDSAGRFDFVVLMMLFLLVLIFWLKKVKRKTLAGLEL